jgi:NAD(P)-dependent dehydrogenase (short-subunit alcohol dehydrogenase family)
MTNARPPLDGKVAVVAGATRGAGRDIAMIAWRGWCHDLLHGRSVRGKLASGRKRPETIDETAARVTKH